MKFKACFSDRGLYTLQKGLLPTLDKFGKTCQLLMEPEKVHLVQTSQDTDGVKVTATWHTTVLFEPGSVCHSRHNNMIAFNFELALMLRVLRAATGNSTDRMEIKLAMRSLGTGAQGPSKPYLTFTSSGPSMSMTQNMPISQPYTASHVDELLAQKDVAPLCSFYCDVLPEVQRIQGMADKMKSISSAATLALTKHGVMHIQVADTGVQLAGELAGLEVLPAHVPESATALTADTVLGRLTEAQQNGDAVSVLLQLKHLSRALATSALMAPAQLLLGVDDGGGFVHFMFVFPSLDEQEGYDSSTSLSFKLPVREEL